VPSPFRATASSFTRNTCLGFGWRTASLAGHEGMIWHHLYVNVKYVRAFSSTIRVHAIYAAFFIAMPSGTARTSFAPARFHAPNAKRAPQLGSPFRFGRRATRARSGISADSSCAGAGSPRAAQPRRPVRPERWRTRGSSPSSAALLRRACALRSPSLRRDPCRESPYRRVP